LRSSEGKRARPAVRHKRRPRGIEPRGTPRLAAELLRWQRSCGQLLQPFGWCMTEVKIPVLDRRPRESASVTDLSGAGGGPPTYHPAAKRQGPAFMALASVPFEVTSAPTCWLRGNKRKRRRETTACKRSLPPSASDRAQHVREGQPQPTFRPSTHRTRAPLKSADTPAGLRLTRADRPVLRA